MLVWNQKIRKTMDLFKAVENELRSRNINVDGIIETFNDGREQGMVLKIYNKYNSDLDICLWAYLPDNRDCTNQMRIVIAKKRDCLENNMWTNELYEEIITSTTARDLHKEAREIVIELIENNYNKKWSLKI